MRVLKAAAKQPYSNAQWKSFKRKNRLIAYSDLEDNPDAPIIQSDYGL